MEGFRTAEDKTSYLRLSGIPFQRSGADGLTLNLVDATIISNWQIGTACPAFGSRELAYMPFPGPMVDARETMNFVYVSLTERADIDLLTLLSALQHIAQSPFHLLLAGLAVGFALVLLRVVRHSRRKDAAHLPQNKR